MKFRSIFVFIFEFLQTKFLEPLFQFFKPFLENGVIVSLFFHAELLFTYLDPQGMFEPLPKNSLPLENQAFEEFGPTCTQSS